MTDGEDWWKRQSPQEGYGQQHPQEPPWERQQYDPIAHQQRLGSQQQPWAPQSQQQGYGRPSRPHVSEYGQQTGWGESPQRPYPQEPSWPQTTPVRSGQQYWPARHKLLTGLLALAAVLVIAVAAVALTGSSKPSSGAAAAAAKTETCKQQYAAWRTGPAKAEGDKMVADLGKVQSAGNAEDIPETDAALKATGNDAAALEAYPMPSCADPAGYWPQILTDLKAGGDNAGSTSGLGGMILALAPLKKVQPLETKLDAELKRTTAH